MIQVGKVITRPFRETERGHVNEEESISVWITENNLTLGFDRDQNISLSPQQAIELAQILMKAAECQAEYSKAAKELEEQKKQLDAKYKDMISGLGLKNPDLKASDLAKQAWSGVTSR